MKLCLFSNNKLHSFLPLVIQIVICVTASFGAYRTSDRRSDHPSVCGAENHIRFCIPASVFYNQYVVNLICAAFLLVGMYSICCAFSYIQD